MQVYGKEDGKFRLLRTQKYIIGSPTGDRKKNFMKSETLKKNRE